MADIDAGSGMTVGRVAARLGLTVRTLHHWDELGLVSPSERTAGGYRLYSSHELERLHRVVVYRELGFGLDRIAELLDETTRPADALRAQRRLVTERIEQLERRAVGLDRLIRAHEKGLLLTSDEQIRLFGAGWDEARHADAAEMYGGTPEWRQFAERSAHRDVEEWRSIAAAVADLDRALAAAADGGVEPGSADANELVDRHRDLFSASYFPLSRSMQVCLGRRFESDPGFAAHYDAIAPGLAVWLRQAIDASAREHGIDPAQARWE